MDRKARIGAILWRTGTTGLLVIWVLYTLVMVAFSGWQEKPFLLAYVANVREFLTEFPFNAIIGSFVALTVAGYRLRTSEPTS